MTCRPTIPAATGSRRGRALGSGRQRHAQHAADPIGLARDLAPGAAQDPEARRDEVGLLEPVALDRAVGAVVGVAVGLEDHALPGPEEVDGVEAT
jgi:hypothetical protein